MLNIVIPMMDLGSRFARAGYREAKPLIPIHGVPMIQFVIATKRWIVGNFAPTVPRSDTCEVAITHYRASDREALHYHPAAFELTAIVSGEVRTSGRRFGSGDIVVLDLGEHTDFEALTDASSVVVKSPGVCGDKYPESSA